MNDEHKLKVAKFSHVTELYNMEKDQPLKLATCLTATTIQPSNIQRCSTKLAHGLFNEKVVSAMQHYNQTEWADTIDFIAYVTQFWKIMNVRSSNTGIQKNDWLRHPVKR